METTMPKEKSTDDSSAVKDFRNFMRVSGYKGGMDKFAEDFLSMNRFQLNYTLKKRGFDEAQKYMLVNALKDGKNRDHGIRDAALSLLEKILDMEIPRGGDSDKIKAKGNNINIKNTNISIGNKDYRELYEEALETIKERDAEIISLKGQILAYKTIYGKSEGESGE